MLDEVVAAGLQERFVGGHPMTGTAHSGWAAGHAGLFTRAPWVVSVDDHVDPAVWSMVMTLALDCGAVVVPAKSDEHDAAAAAISHLPHLLAEALAVTAGRGPAGLRAGRGVVPRRHPGGGHRPGPGARDVRRQLRPTAAGGRPGHRVAEPRPRVAGLATTRWPSSSRRAMPRARATTASRAPTIFAVVIGAENWREELAAAGRAGGVIRSALPSLDSPR